jgi:FkbM family methyltransferase
MLTKIIDTFFIKNPKLRRLVTKIFYGSKTKIVSIFGEHVTINSLRENGYLRAAKMSASSSFLRDEVPVIVALANVISDNSTFVDVGANIGIYSIIFSKFKKIYKNFKIVAFEVHPDTYSRLEKNASEHDFLAKNVGMGDADEVAKFLDGAVSHVVTRFENKTNYNISSETFDAKISYLSNFDFDGDLIIKIDVEGQELRVLRGADKYFEMGRVKCVYLDGYYDKRCFDFLVEHRFDLFDGRTLAPAHRGTFSLLALKK